MNKQAKEEQPDEYNEDISETTVPTTSITDSGKGITTLDQFI